MFEEEHLDQVFELLGRVAEAFAAMVGPHCEIVVLDLRSPEHTVVAIGGNVTNRTVGSPAPDPKMLLGTVDQYTDDLLMYRSVTPFGRELVSSDIWIRNREGHIVGAISINMDFNDLRLAGDLLDRVRRDLERITVRDPNEIMNPNSYTFSRTPEEFVALAIRSATVDFEVPARDLNRDNKLLVISRLAEAGVFQLRRAADIVASELGVSRASVYSYLKELRSEEASLSTGSDT